MGLVDWMSTRPVRPRESATCTLNSLMRWPPSTKPTSVASSLTYVAQPSLL